ncbi:hypothetical protein Q8W71_19965 [Methylobacterium sp. NEAU 140]|uniref:hypothetical protein n=1 Tax=Methylobacterium sp. NEAU 140 TaxID=3064945 RepID=UPI0027328FF0|nr:hypothetical protein [Methylobacterium sp. NEAU 140]MDP4024911.1 hypothetical protein [Methylobacterium sp. NEAU 140]
MTGEERAAFKRRTTEAFLRVALRTTLVRMGELSGSRADETLRQFERAFDRGLRTLPSPAGAELATMVAAEDAVSILRDCVEAARRTLAASIVPAEAACAGGPRA